MDNMKAKWNILNQRLWIVKTGSRELRNTKTRFCALLLFSMMIAALFALSPTFSSLISSVVINTTGQISLSSITAKSGSPADIQTAVNAVMATGGGTVYIPPGDWLCDQTANGAIFIDLETLPNGAWLNIIGSYYNVTTTTNTGQSITSPATILRSTTPTPTSGSISTFNIVGSNTSYSTNFDYVRSQNRHIRISGITILGKVTSETANNHGIVLRYVDGFLIDHVAIDSSVGSDIGVVASKGVITSSYISDTYHITEGGTWGYGISVSGNSNLWPANLGTATWINNLTQVIGKYDWQGINITYSNPQSGNFSTTGWTTNISYTAGPVYIENNYFYWCRHGITSNNYGYYVARYNVINMVPNNSYFDVHGAGFPSGRAIEMYNNTCLPYGGAIGVSPRGGGGVIFNNLFNGTGTGIGLEQDGYNSSDPNNPQYINDLWIWNNTYTNVGKPFQVQSGVGIVAGTNYYKDTSDGTAATTPAPPRLNYAPYTYPHPLTLGP
jgi:hypothetical protein